MSAHFCTWVILFSVLASKGWSAPSVSLHAGDEGKCTIQRPGESCPPLPPVPAAAAPKAAKLEQATADGRHCEVRCAKDRSHCRIRCKKGTTPDCRCNTEKQPEAACVCR